MSELWKTGTNPEKLGGISARSHHKSSLVRETLQISGTQCRHCWWRSEAHWSLLLCDTQARHHVLGGMGWSCRLSSSCVLVAKGWKDLTFSASTVGGGTPTSYQSLQTEGGLCVRQPAKHKGSPTEGVLLCLWFVYSLSLQRMHK